jgi:hypothetical protein
MASVIPQIEVVSPGYCGEAAAVIWQLAAGDDVAPDDLTAALAWLRLTPQGAVALLEENAPPNLDFRTLPDGGIGKRAEARFGEMVFHTVAAANRSERGIEEFAVGKTVNFQDGNLPDGKAVFTRCPRYAAASDRPAVQCELPSRVSCFSEAAYVASRTALCEQQDILIYSEHPASDLPLCGHSLGYALLLESV